MNIDKLKQLKKLIIELTNYISQLTIKSNEITLDSLENIKKYNEFLQTIPEEEIKEVDDEISIYYEMYTQFLQNRKYIE